VSQVLSTPIGARNCTDSEYWLRGACVARLCPPSEQFCADDTTAAVCNEIGNMVVSTTDCRSMPGYFCGSSKVCARAFLSEGFELVNSMTVQVRQ
jgi:hypothetical protein